MARMLFLRDIDADVQLRCRTCGHGGVLPRAMLERRFGPNYPVLSIAPHYRCSRCDSRDIESRPILAEPLAAGLPAASNDEPSFDAPLAALNGLLASLRGGDGGRDRTADAEEPPAPPPPPPAPVRGKPVLERPLSDLVADGPAEDGAAPLWEPVSLADMAARLGRPSPPDEWDDDWEDEPSTGDARTAANDERPEPARDEVAAAGAPDGADSEVGDPEEDDGDETLMAMRRLLAQAYGSDDDEDDPAPAPQTARAASFAEHPPADGPAGDGPDLNVGDQDEGDQGEDDLGGDEPPVFSHKVLVRRDFEDDGADAGADPWHLESRDAGQEDDPEDGGPDGEEPSEEEILSFAIRDPEKPAPPPASRPAKPAPPPAEPLDFDQHRAERRAQRPPPPPEDEEGFDRTLAALRSMIEDAANEPAEEEEDAAPPPAKGPRNAGRMVEKPARREEPDDPAPDLGEDDWSVPAGWDDPDPAPEAAAPEQEKDPDPAPAGRRSAQEREIEEAMKALRGLIEDEIQPDSPPASQPKPRAAKPRPPARSGSAAPEAGPLPNAKPPDVQPETANPANLEAKPAGEPTPLSKTIAALRGMLELDGRRKR